MNILVLSDNERMISSFRILVEQYLDDEKFNLVYAYSPSNTTFKNNTNLNSWTNSLDVKRSVPRILDEFDLVFSVHSKQLFPPEMVKGVRCINVHPGYNPYNRGWYPQVFSILNGHKCGVTIHEIDEKLDHGPIICQREVEIKSYDTSLSAYDKLLNAEVALLEEWLVKLVEGEYEVARPHEGNLNLKKDFNNLCHLDTSHVGTLKEHIDLLRALTHGDFNNAFYLEDDKKVYVKIAFTLEENQESDLNE